jgi:hypothetical protein
MNDEVKQLLEDIRDWMIENDYECGEVGSEIYQRINRILTPDVVDTRIQKFVDTRIQKLKNDWDKL